jgi:phosphopantothenoylcysteine decarboxylase/phosphopantothenate--cysteine ligase
MANVVVCVGGGVAAYKACDLVSKLVQAGHRVDVVLTRMATRFVRPLSFSALTQRRVHTDRGWGEGTHPAEHLSVTRDAQLLIVAPCTANLLGRFAHGLADEIVSTTVLGAGCPVLLAPAMNARMWKNPRVQANAQLLKGDGLAFVGPDEGWLAEGETGIGRMAEPAAILEAAGALLTTACGVSDASPARKTGKPPPRRP